MHRCRVLLNLTMKATPRQLFGNLPKCDYDWIMDNSHRFNDVISIGKHVLDTYDKQYAFIKARTKSPKTISSNIDNIIDYINCNNVGTSSVKKGQIGEEVIAKILTDWYGDECVERTGTKARMTDILVHVDNPRSCTVAVEVKNYTNKVSALEIEKFKRDLKLIPNAVAGVFITIGGSKYDARNGDQIKYEVINNQRMPIIFVYIDTETNYTIINESVSSDDDDRDDDDKGADGTDSIADVVGPVTSQVRWAVNIAAQLGCTLEGINNIARDIISAKDNPIIEGYDKIATVLSNSTNEKNKALELLSKFSSAMAESLTRLKFYDENISDIVKVSKVDEQIKMLVGNDIESVRTLFDKCENDDLVPLVNRVVTCIENVTKGAPNSWVVKAKKAESTITSIRITLARGNKKIDVSFPNHYIKRDSWYDLIALHSDIVSINAGRIVIALTDHSITLIENLIIYGKHD